MTKTLLSASVLTTLLCGAALANPPPPAASVRLTITVTSSAGVRSYDLLIGENGCGTVQEKAASYEDEVRVCSVVASNGLRVELEGKTRAGASEYRSKSEMVLARKGATAQIGRTGGVRFTVKTI
jgi:hypothetical protein